MRHSQKPRSHGPVAALLPTRVEQVQDYALFEREDGTKWFYTLNESISHVSFLESETPVETHRGQAISRAIVDLGEFRFWKIY